MIRIGCSTLCSDPSISSGFSPARSRPPRRAGDSGGWRLLRVLGRGERVDDRRSEDCAAAELPPSSGAPCQKGERGASARGTPRAMIASRALGPIQVEHCLWYGVLLTGKTPNLTRCLESIQKIKEKLEDLVNRRHEWCFRLGKWPCDTAQDSAEMRSGNASRDGEAMRHHTDLRNRRATGSTFARDEFGAVAKSSVFGHGLPW